MAIVHRIPEGSLPRPPSAAVDRPAAWELWIVAGLVVVTMLDLANYGGELYGFPPKLAYFPMLGASAAILLGSSRLELGRVRLAIVAFVLTYFAVNLLHVLYFGPDATGERDQIGWSRIQFLALGFGIALTTTVLPQVVLARLFGLCAALIATSMLVDFLQPGLLYGLDTPGVVPGRVGSFFINANKAGEAVVLTTLMALPAVTRRTALPLLLLAGAAVLVTFSRAAMVGWVLLVALFWWSGLLQRVQLLIGAGLLGLLVAGGGLLSFLVDAQDLPGIDTADIFQRLQFLKTGDLHDDSGQERGYVLVEGLRLFLANPLFGAGVGATHLWAFPVAPHNQAVMMAAEYGLFGVAGWVGLIWLAATGSYFGSRSRQWSIAGFVFLLSMATHNMLDFPYWMNVLLVASMRYRPMNGSAASRP